MHKQAALNTLKAIGIGLISGLAIVLAIQMLTFDIAIKIFAIGILVYFIYIYYSIEKGRLESKKLLDEMSK